MKQIVGILLGAGSGSRFGSDKRLHPLPDGTPILLASARNLAKACSRTIVVIRPGDTVLASLLASEKIEAIVCEDAEKGMGHSLSRGVSYSAEADGWLVALADMPYVKPVSYQAVLGALQNGENLVRPTHNGKVGHPVGFSAKYRRDLLSLVGDQGGKSILGAYREDLRCCPVDDQGIIQDIDQVSDVMVA